MFQYFSNLETIFRYAMVAISDIRSGRNYETF